MSTIRVLIADDHPVVREGLAGMLSAQPEFEVVGVASDGNEAVELYSSLEPDVTLLDLRMPNLDGVGAIKAIRLTDSEARILVLTTYDTDTDIVRSIEAGATGYLLKDAPREELFAAIRSVSRGESVLAPAVASRVMARMRAPAGTQLSGREIEVLELVSRGASNSDIGEELHISVATVKTHLVHIYDKLGVDDRTSAVTHALEQGIITLDR